MPKLILVLLLLISVAAFSQEKKFNEMMPDIEWGGGTIMDNDGSELKGMVKYDDHNGIVSFENGNDSRAFSPRSIQGFEFFDETQQRQRIFYTLEYEDPHSGAPRPYFFEVLKDFKTFAVLAKMDPIEIKEKKNSSGAASINGIGVILPAGTTVTINQTETIYFLSGSGKIEPYLKVIRKVVDRNLYDRSKIKNRVIDDSLPKRYFVEPGFSKMKKYAKDNDLDLEIKNDFIKILAYYETYLTENQH